MAIMRFAKMITGITSQRTITKDSKFILPLKSQMLISLKDSIFVAQTT